MTPDRHGPDESDDVGADWASEDPRVQAGMDHLQRAAHEVIAASRALLDVAEEMVDDPRSAGNLLGMLSSVSNMAARMARSAAPGQGGDIDGDDDDGGGSPVQRIPVS